MLTEKGSYLMNNSKMNNVRPSGQHQHAANSNRHGSEPPVMRMQSIRTTIHMLIRTLAGIRIPTPIHIPMHRIIRKAC